MKFLNLLLTILEEKKMDASETIKAAMGGYLNSTGVRPTDGKQHVQNDLLIDEDRYRLFYITIYDAEPNVSPVEAYVLYDKRSHKLSFYDNDSNELYIDDKYVGKVNNIDTIDDVVQHYKFEAGHGRLVKGATQAYYNALNELT